MLQQISQTLARHSRRCLVAPLNANSTAVSVSARAMGTASPWANFQMAPPDPIIGLNEAFALDDYPKKVIVGVGAYRDDKGKPYVLPCVREAEQRIVNDLSIDMEYLGIVSVPTFERYLTNIKCSRKSLLYNAGLTHFLPPCIQFFPIFYCRPEIRNLSTGHSSLRMTKSRLPWSKIESKAFKRCPGPVDFAYLEN
jgi:hypothetical protein